MILEAFDTLLAGLLLAVQQVYGERLVTLAIYGSVGRRTPRADSDIDMLVIVEGLPPNRSARQDEFLAVDLAVAVALRRSREQGLNTCFSPILKTPEEAALGSPLFLDMIDDARLLFDRDDFFRGLLTEMKARLDRQGARRIWRGSSWVWDLKPDAVFGDRIEI